MALDKQMRKDIALFTLSILILGFATHYFFNSDTEREVIAHYTGTVEKAVDEFYADDFGNKHVTKHLTIRLHQTDQTIYLRVSGEQPRLKRPTPGSNVYVTKYKGRFFGSFYSYGGLVD